MKFGRAALANVEGYTPGEQPQQPGVIKLNTNENPYPPSRKVIEALQQLSPDACRKYPDPLSVALREACAKRYGYPSADWVIAGNGLDEILALAVRTFVDPGDAILTPYPTYTLYETLARFHGAEIRLVDLDDEFQLREAFFNTPARLAFLSRPNAPSGVASPREHLERFCAGFNGLVFIDEAYVDFADDNCMDFPKRFENVIVGRSFSKSFSLAGLRVGAAVARPEIIREFEKTKDSYNLNAVSQTAACAALSDYETMQSNSARIRATRARLTQSLVELGFHVPPSQANFILAVWNGAPPAREIFEQLRERAIFVRYFNTRRLENALRITIGTDEETARLIEALQAIVA